MKAISVILNIGNSVIKNSQVNISSPQIIYWSDKVNENTHNIKILNERTNQIQENNCF